MAKGTRWILITAYDNWVYMDPDWGSDADENIDHRKEEWDEKVKAGIFEQNQHLRIDRTLYREITIKDVLEINRESVGIGENRWKSAKIGENRPSYEFYLCVIFLLLFPLFLKKKIEWCAGISVVVKNFPEVWSIWLKSPKNHFYEVLKSPLSLCSGRWWSQARTQRNLSDSRLIFRINQSP